MAKWFPDDYNPLRDLEEWLGYSIIPPQKKLYTRKDFAEYKEATVEYTKHYHLNDEGEELTSHYFQCLDLQSIRNTYDLFN